jgi:glycosyltransferase involved in cell wall biosynthesis
MEFIDSGNLDAQVVVMRRRLLALAWMMPPLIFPRSLQVSRTLRAMSERGWNITVFAVPPDVEPFAAQDPRLEQVYQGSYEIRYVEPREEVESSPLWLRIARRIARTKNVRDPNWIRRASKALCQQIKTERPDALVSFAQPWINHQVALRVKRRYPRLPWIVHFSDPWVDSPYFHPSDEKTRVAAVIQEREIISAADVVIFTTQETVNLVMAKYPDAWVRKVHVLSHGYDADLLDLIKPQPKSPKFKIIHTGNLYEKREPLALLRALATLRAEQTSAEIQVEFVGYATKTMHDTVKHLDLGDMVSLAPNVPFLESLAIGQSADLLLVIDAPAERSVFLPSKIVDYLSLRRPILALTPQAGASARVLGDLGFPIVDPTDETGLLAILRESLARWQRGENATPVPPHEEMRAFNIREVVAGFEAAVMSAIRDEEHKNG